MPQLAAHYIIANNCIYKMHYIEIQNNRISQLKPLEQEIANTEFLSGILVVIPKTKQINEEIIKQWKNQYPEETLMEILLRITTPSNEDTEEITIYHLSGYNLSTSELGTNHSSSNSHIQRL